MSNKAGWWWEARVVVGGWQPGREFGARRQVEVEAKDLQAAANELLCWSRSYKGEEKILDKQGQVYFSSQCNGLQWTGCLKVKPTLSLVDISSAGLANHWEKTQRWDNWRCGQDLSDQLLQVFHNQLVCMKDAQQVAVPVAKADQADQHGDHHGRDHHGLRSPLWIQLKVLGGDREDGLGGAGGDSFWNL